MSPIHWRKLLIYLLITVVLLMLGFQLYQKYLVELPLVSQLEQVEGVINVQVDDNKDASTIKINLGAIDNLAITFEEISQVIEANDHFRDYSLQISGNSSKKADLLMADLSLEIYQGLETGKYKDIEKVINTRSVDYNWTAKVQMDESRLFISLYGNRFQWYEIITRHRSGETEVP